MSRESMKGLTYPGEAVFDIVEKATNNCAASPWTYRTDTGDETGKVVESAELPSLDKGGWYLGRYSDGRYRSFTVEYDSDLDDSFHVDENGWIDEDWLRKHLIAYAEIRSSHDR